MTIRSLPVITAIVVDKHNRVLCAYSERRCILPTISITNLKHINAPFTEPLLDKEGFYRFIRINYSGEKLYALDFKCNPALLQIAFVDVSEVIGKRCKEPVEIALEYLTKEIMDGTL